MTISLDKGGSISLTKVAQDAGRSLSKVTVGLGWKANTGKTVQVVRRRLFGGTKTVEEPVSRDEYDLDASVFVLGRNGRLLDSDWFIYYGNKVAPKGVVKHSGDNLVGGSGTKDDEQIVIHLDRLPAQADRVVVVVNIYQAQSRNQCFGDVEHSYMRILDDQNTEMVRYNLTDQFGQETAVVFGELYRDEAGWQFRAIGEGQISDLSGLKRQYV